MQNKEKIVQEIDVQEVLIPCGDVQLQGILSIPKNAKGIVLFAHGSGSGRFSPRNQYVAKVLMKAHLATLLMDLLTIEEERIDEVTRQLRFDIALLSERLSKVAAWVKKEEKTKSLKIGYFGASTGAAAALISAAENSSMIHAVVSRGGRPDLAGKSLSSVLCPTLLIVGGADYQVIELNQEAFELLSSVKKMEIVPGATHLFEEVGTLEKVAELASNWFLLYLK